MPATRILKATNDKLDNESLQICVEALRQGHPIVFPTDTVYGIGCIAFHPHAIQKIYQLKGRHYNKALPLLLGDRAQLPLVTDEVLPRADRLMSAFWPGPLTLVFKTAPMVMTATHGRKTVAVRIPDHGVVKQILDGVGVPLATTSANLSGHGSVKTFPAVKKIFTDQVPVIVDGGRCRWAHESSVVDVTHEPFTVIREGAVSKAALLNKITEP